jgi:hypothetical protein
MPLPPWPPAKQGPQPAGKKKTRSIWHGAGLSRQVCCGRSKGRKRVFLKKEAKTFAPWGARCPAANPMKSKVFWFFFSKKNRFLLRRATTKPQLMTLPH